MKINLENFNLSKEALDYFNSKPTFEEAWNECDNGYWMLLIARKFGVDEGRMPPARVLICSEIIDHIQSIEQFQKKTADICRKYLTEEVFKKIREDAKDFIELHIKLYEILPLLDKWIKNEEAKQL